MNSKKTMLINATDPEEIRVATLIDGVLFDYDVEFLHNEKIKGNLYKAKVVRVDTSLQAAFVHFGGQKNGFLPLGELPRDLSGDGRRARIQDVLQRDQEILVQAVREELGSKGAMMTGQVSLAGRYLVITPGNPVNGISRKIEATEERRHFKQLIDTLDIPEDIGVIVRTASLGVTKEDFERDLEYLLDTYKEVLSRYKHRHGVGLVWQEDDVVTRTLRDTFSADVEEVQIDDLDTFHAAQSFFKRTMPQHLDVLKHYTGKKPLFSRHQLEEQIDRVYGRKVGLPSGGALVLDQTEALVAIDVNSGKTSGDGVEDMAFKTNMEAAEEVARQLRLRDLAGLIAIDFIDMKRDTHIRAVQDRLVDCLKADKARMEVGKINRFGVLVMTRQRIRPSLQHVNHESCPACAGTGKVKTIEAMALSVVRKLHGILAKGGIGEIRVKLAPAIATAVLNQKRRELTQMEEESEAKISIQADWSMSYGEMSAEIERSEEVPVEKPAPRPHREKGAPEDETVVLGGDSPISFDKALGVHGDGPKDAKKEAFKYDRRDLQRAALDERERLRALFESAKPEDDESEEGAEEAGEDVKGEGAKRKRRRRRRKGGADRGAEAQVQTGGLEPRPEPNQRAVESQPEPPKATPDLVASLLTPNPRPKFGQAQAAPAVEEVSKPKRTPRAKVASAPEAAPAPQVAAVVEAPVAEAPEKKKAAPKAKAPKTPAVKKAKAEKPAPEEAPKVKATRAKKAKVE
ncbi:Rne/Rng family ribonuclease [Geothrix sp. PMB-07]|uniref:Rne/Rng family ribonuclease n=1 Tax=Geothrix sp. PMB-07 TaxID=3068640 RepID=UPI002742811C|nr:Rne/Rng family ribonuclease [Geothrix sp. PMB-07]WLT33406.1 Rne/Rng family ribonuclease [Geothrix sp. PMB-07]